MTADSLGDPGRPGRHPGHLSFRTPPRREAGLGQVSSLSSLTSGPAQGSGQKLWFDCVPAQNPDLQASKPRTTLR